MGLAWRRKESSGGEYVRAVAQRSADGPAGAGEGQEDKTGKNYKRTERSLPWKLVSNKLEFPDDSGNVACATGGG